MTRLIDVEPCRALRTSRRALTGRVAIGESASAGFASSLERDWIEQLDFLPEVVALQVQPFTLHYQHEGRSHRYTPDVAAIWALKDGTEQTVIYEVKPRVNLQAEWAIFRPRFGAATRYCRQQGWRFKVVNEKHIRGPRLAAIRFLRRYMRLPADPDIQQDLVKSLRTIGPTTVAGLLAAAYWSSENRAIALPYLWKLIAEHVIQAPLDRPLTMSTPIRFGA